MSWLPGDVRMWEADSAPAVTDDEDSGYVEGDLWVDNTGKTAYVLKDKTAGAAVWAELGGGSVVYAGNNILATQVFG